MSAPLCGIFILTLHVVHEGRKCMLGLNQTLTEGMIALSVLGPYCHGFGGFKSTDLFSHSLKTSSPSQYL